MGTVVQIIQVMAVQNGRARLQLAQHTCQPQGGCSVRCSRGMSRAPVQRHILLRTQCCQEVASAAVTPGHHARMAHVPNSGAHRVGAQGGHKTLFPG